MKSQGRQSIKFAVMSKAFRSSGNKDLKQQLKAIEIVEDGNQQSHVFKSINCQNAIKGNFMKIFHNDMNSSFKSRNRSSFSLQAPSHQSAL